jgi:predicted nucleic acid-binding protein
MRAVIDTNILVRAMLKPDGSVGPVLTAADVDALCALVIRRGELVRPGRTVVVCRDPKDNKFLEVAVAGRADMIVTGDEDLKVLDPFEGVPVVPSARFLHLRSQSHEGSGD